MAVFAQQPPPSAGLCAAQHPRLTWQPFYGDVGAHEPAFGRGEGEEGNDRVRHKLPPMCGAGNRGQPVVAGAAAGPGRAAGAGGVGRRCHKMAVLCAAPLGRRGKRPRGSKAALRWPRRHWLRAPRGPPGAERAGSGGCRGLPPLPLLCRAWARSACILTGFHFNTASYFQQSLEKKQGYFLRRIFSFIFFLFFKLQKEL